MEKEDVIVYINVNNKLTYQSIHTLLVVRTQHTVVEMLMLMQPKDIMTFSHYETFVMEVKVLFCQMISLNRLHLGIGWKICTG